MKKSAYRVERLALWRRHYCGDDDCFLWRAAEEQVERDVAAAEAAGVRWEAEVPSNMYFAPRRGSLNRIATAVFPLSYICLVSPSPETDETLREAVRRYNCFSSDGTYRRGDA